uniref:Large ribosomal subunit protein eL6 n=1 Tax=Corethrella appendiculata TaxID=1370023 RepID=U5EWM6_9DIPT
MAPTQKTVKPAKTGDKKTKKHQKLKNRDLGNGIQRFSRAKQYRRKRIFVLKTTKKVRPEKPKVAITVVKKIGGAKNGGERIVRLQKPKAYYATKNFVQKRPAKRCFKNHPRYIRQSLKPGVVLILLAGRHKGKRVVLLKSLQSGLLLVTGPFEYNSCPMRRISQRYVIATKTSVDLKDFKLPAHINDGYFKRIPKRKNRGEIDIFAKKEEKYVASAQRKADQKVVDEQVYKAIKAHKEYQILKRYLKSMFSLRSNHYPHRMKF